MFEKAQVGDKVWSIEFGWGEVLGIPDRGTILVNFPNRTHQRYFPSGARRSAPVDVKPTLFWDEIKFTIPPAPKRKIKKEGWCRLISNPYGNVYLNTTIYASREEAINPPEIIMQKGYKLVAVKKIEWEEEEE